MRSERKKQVMTLSILLVAVLVVSIGFAAFTRTFEFETTLTVNPDSRAFSVKFSKTDSIPATSGTVTPTITPSTETANLSREIVASDATVDGNTTVSGLYATLISPGDKVLYYLYAVNEGKYDTYLSNVQIGSITCTAGEGATASLVAEACKGIQIKVTANGRIYTSSATSIVGDALYKGGTHRIAIEIGYNSSAVRADGPFTVNIGDISLYYSTKPGDNPAYTGSIYRNSTDSLGIGDSIKNILYQQTPLNINRTYYLKHDVVDDIVTASYACITYIENGTRKDVCLRGYDKTYYASNQAILKSVESYFNTLDYSASTVNNGKGCCFFYDSQSFCRSDSLILSADSFGHASAYDGSSNCNVNFDGHSICD